jgi:uncharacterized protein YdgA (DUF945 family)
VKKLVIGVVVVVVLLVVAPWGVGKVAEKRLDRGIDKLVEIAPYLTVVERKYTPGWFKSEQVVTFEAFGSWMKALNPKVLEDAMANEAAGAEDSVESDVDAGVPTGEAAPSADAVPGDEAAAAVETVPTDEAATPDETPKPEEMMRFTVRNEILHGPVLGLSGIGIARVDSHLVLTDEVRKDIEAIFGPKAPLEVRTRIGFTGGGTTTFKSEGRTIKPKDSKVTITWDTLKLAIGFSRKGDKYDVDGAWPRFEVRDASEEGGARYFLMTDMTMDGNGRRVRGELYDGDFDLSIAKVSIDAKKEGQYEVSDAHYIVSSETKGEFTAMSARMGTGEIRAKELAAKGIQIKEIHYDLAARRLHADTLEKMMKGFKDMYAQPLTDPTQAEKVMLGPFKEQGLQLLKHDPEFVLERIGMATPEGEGYLRGVIKLLGVTEEDFATGAMSMIGKIDADLTVEVDVKMVEKLGGAIAVGAAVDSGYVEKKGEKLICKILFKKGELTINGKPQAIPGLGGPPGAGAPGEEAEAPVPQE